MNPKPIVYILSAAVTATAVFFSIDNKKKLEGEIATFVERRTTKDAVERNEDKTQQTLTETEAVLETAQKLNADLIAEMENMKSRETLMNKSKEEAQVKIDESDARLSQLAEIKAKIDKALEGVNIAWPQIPSEIKRLQEVRKKKGDDLDLLNAVSYTHLTLPTKA